MIPAIKAEFRKLPTTRSTYVLIAFCIAMTVLYAFYLEGVRTTIPLIENPDRLASVVKANAQFLGLFIAIAGVLLVTHEYRYNTIMYTLTAARSRGVIVLAKVIVVTTFSVLLTVVLCAAAPYLTMLGLHVNQVALVPQELPLPDLLGRVALYGWGYSMLGLIIALLVRSQVATFMIFLLLPTLGEALLSLLLKQNAQYLPFTALQNTLTNSSQYPNALWVLLAYIAGGLLVAWTLFQQRDAN